MQRLRNGEVERAFQARFPTNYTMAISPSCLQSARRIRDCVPPLTKTRKEKGYKAHGRSGRPKAQSGQVPTGDKPKEAC